MGLLEGQRELKARAAIGGTVGPNPAAVTDDDPMHNGQSDAGA